MSYKICDWQKSLLYYSCLSKAQTFFYYFYFKGGTRDVYSSTGAYFANKAKMKLQMSDKGFLNPNNPDQRKTPWIVKAITILNTK